MLPLKMLTLIPNSTKPFLFQKYISGEGAKAQVWMFWLELIKDAAVVFELRS